MPNSDNDRVHVFVSYSHKDSRWLERLKVHLAPLTADYDIDLWDDTRLRPGLKWRQELQKSLNRADVAILIISADFLASEFIRTNELPPLLRAAEEEGALILSIIASPSLFVMKTELSQFQAVNNLSRPLISATEGEQEAVFVRVAEELIERVSLAHRQAKQNVIESGVTRKEDFLEHPTWTRLIKIGDWIFDEQRAHITGSGARAYLLSREEYGEAAFAIRTKLEFTNFLPPTDQSLGMNAGIIFGWKSEKGVNRYLNILLTGAGLLVERIGFKGGSEGQDYEHLTNAVPLPIESEKPTLLEVRVTTDQIEIDANNGHILSLQRPTGVVGRVGLRPWRSIMVCTKFIVAAGNLPGR